MLGDIRVRGLSRDQLDSLQEVGPGPLCHLKDTGHWRAQQHCPSHGSSERRAQALGTLASVVVAPGI